MENRKRKLSPTNMVIIFLVLLIMFLGGYLVFGTFYKTDTENNNETQATPTPTSTTAMTATPTMSGSTPPTTITPSSTTTPTPSTTVTPSASLTPTYSGSGPVKVFFSRRPDSENDFKQVFFVVRNSTRADVENYVVEQYLKGPTASEVSARPGLFTPAVLTGASNCGGKDFTLTVVKESKKATLKFCKQVTSNGVGDDARIKNTLTATVTDLEAVDKLVILTKDDNCFGDMSGTNQCKL